MKQADRRARVRERFFAERLVLVARHLQVAQAGRVARALLDGGLSSIEVTFENPHAREVVEHIRSAVGESILVGAGTVTTTARFELARELDVDFVVSPIFDEDIVRACVEEARFVIPGALTPSEVQRAWASGADMVKIFPVELMSPNYVKALREPLPEPLIMATGGIRLNRIAALSRSGVDVMGVGSGILDPAALEAGDYDRIRDNAAQFVGRTATARATERTPNIPEETA